MQCSCPEGQAAECVSNVLDLVWENTSVLLLVRNGSKLGGSGNGVSHLQWWHKAHHLGGGRVQGAAGYQIPAEVWSSTEKCQGSSVSVVWGCLLKLSSGWKRGSCSSQVSHRYPALPPREGTKVFWQGLVAVKL